MEELRKKLVDTINNANLPFECIFYVIKDIFREVNDLYQEQLKNIEKKEENTQEEDETK